MYGLTAIFSHYRVDLETRSMLRPLALCEPGLAIEARRSSEPVAKQNELRVSHQYGMLPV